MNSRKIVKYILKNMIRMSKSLLYESTVLFLDHNILDLNHCVHLYCLTRIIFITFSIVCNSAKYLSVTFIY